LTAGQSNPPRCNVVISGTSHTRMSLCRLPDASARFAFVHIPILRHAGDAGQDRDRFDDYLLISVRGMS
jgi:hypothetical protein